MTLLATQVRVVLIDDSEMLCAAWSKLLKKSTDMTLVHYEMKVERALQAVREHEPDVVLMDVMMDGAEQVEVVPKLMAERPKVRVLLYSGHSDPQLINAARLAGAKGFVSKHEEPRRVLDAIKRVASGLEDFPTSGA